MTICAAKLLTVEIRKEKKLKTEFLNKNRCPGILFYKMDWNCSRACVCVGIHVTIQAKKLAEINYFMGTGTTAVQASASMFLAYMQFAMRLDWLE